MRNPLICCVFVLLLLLSACSDETVAPHTDNIEKDSTLAIVSLSEDSVYWGDTVSVHLKHTKTDSFRLFIDTVEWTMLNSVRAMDGTAVLHFIVSESTPSGVVSVVESDSTQAISADTLVVIPQDPRQLNIEVYSIFPRDGYTDELVTISGKDLPLRRSDLRVRIGNVETPIVSNTSTKIVVRVTADVKTDTVWVHTTDTVFKPEIFRKMEFEGQFLSDATYYSIRLRINGVQATRTITEEKNGEVVSTTSSPVSSLGGGATFGYHFNRKYSGDTIILDGLQYDSEGFRWMEFRYVLHSQNRVSGTIQIGGSYEKEGGIVYATIKEMRWKNRYTVYAFGPDIQALVKANSKWGSGSGQDRTSASIVYDKGGEDSFFEIEFIPH